MPYYAGTATVTIGLWAKKSGAWVKVGTTTKNVQGTDGVASSAGQAFSKTISVACGTGIEAFGITIDSVDNGTSGALTAFTSVTWVKTTTSGVRSATPSSQKGRITVRPQ